MALDVQDVSKTLEIPIIVSPPVPLISIMVKSLGIPVYSQHVDVDAVGSSTGAVIPELLQSLGVRGSILNHSERRIPIKDIEELIKRLDRAEKSEGLTYDQREAIDVGKAVMAGTEERWLTPEVLAKAVADGIALRHLQRDHEGLERVLRSTREAAARVIKGLRVARSARNGGSHV